MKNISEEIRDEEWVMGRRNRYHGLLPLTEACHSCGDPQESLRIVHVAGTNGKGSTVNYLKDILISCGYTVGTFTSPHLTTHRDRIRINGEFISHETFMEYLRKDMELIEKHDLGMFEIDTLIMFQWFHDRNVDYAIVEAGLGGRLDNTNIIRKPVLEIITTIAMDHMNVLGNRIEQIAFEKAGIIKPYTACALGYIRKDAEEIIRMNAWNRHARTVPVREYRDTGAHRFEYMNTEYTVQGAEYQKKNASLALHSAWMLGEDISADHVVQAVAQSFWAGRFEQVAEDPAVIVDGAHNEEAVQRLAESYPLLKRPVTTVFSALKDKPGRKMARMLRNVSDRLIITHFENYRSGPASDLAVKGAEVIGEWQEAVKEALMHADGGTVVITGSLYFVSVVREYFEEMRSS